MSDVSTNTLDGAATQPMTRWDPMIVASIILTVGALAISLALLFRPAPAAAAGGAVATPVATPVVQVHLPAPAPAPAAGGATTPQTPFEQAMAEREAVRLATDKAIDTARSSRAAMRAPNEYRVGG